MTLKQYLEATGISYRIFANKAGLTREHTRKICLENKNETVTSPIYKQKVLAASNGAVDLPLGNLGRPVNWRRHRTLIRARDSGASWREIMEFGYKTETSAKNSVRWARKKCRERATS